MVQWSNYNKGKTTLLSGLVLGFTLCHFVYTYWYLGDLKPQPLCRPAPSGGLSPRTEAQTNIPNTTDGPTAPPGPVHPAPFNVTNPLSGYVNVLKDREALRLHCGVCALVSTSGHVLNHTAGAEIDQAECVIRMNHSPVNGFEKHVGKRTTVRIVTHSSFEFAFKEITQIISKENRSKLVVWGPDDAMRTNGKGKTYNHLFNLTKVSKDVEFYMLSPERMLYSHKLFDNETGLQRRVKGGLLWLSTGWFTMILATEMCDQVKVYGMSNGENCRDPNAYPAAYHYFDSDNITYAEKECDEYNRMEKREKDAHRFFIEKTVFERWSKYHKITFHFPSWKRKG
ncbi:alpha-N-acetyl-neuraminyl-2,3-beta-galactosyl-1,3-N-acetyl-galactosaminide alpha-2,6-sialyltransferase-like [Branchiostoma lanceolatum]|uniref:alpha-N-acetyl-neuraminyl-2,3-beta-galactosyl-1, 3-N-acetyl-galactosaminide alpha-2,6-sialyltransferase-like n=1 Tax=Branchiostoma lanceolatum TaxID=7740 RepID=UPI00345617C1